MQPFFRRSTPDSRFRGRSVALLVAALVFVICAGAVTAQEATPAEIEFWQSVKDSKDPLELEAYLKSYPGGKFADLAKLRLQKLRPGNDTSAPAEKAKQPQPDGQTATPEPKPTDAGSAASSRQQELYRSLDFFGDVLERVRNDYLEKPDDRQLIEAAVSGMLSSLDPHSGYIPPGKFRDMQGQTRGESGGLGMEMTMENGVVKVVAPIEDTPAYKAGVQPNDLITHLDNEQIVGLTLEQVTEKMRGPVDTSVSLTIVRKGKDEPFEIKLTRAVIRINPVKARAEGDVAYVKVKTFNDQTHANLVKEIEGLKKQIGKDLKGYVIDLRNNPGGLLDQAIAVSDAFLESGTIVLTKGRNNEETQRSQARPGDIFDGKKLVVLINGGTASGSEIVAGALQDNKRAIVIGTRSFGMGSVQTMIPFGANGAIRLTTARFYTPSNRSIQAKGIDPDILVEQELPREPKSKLHRPRGESSLRSHLSGEGGEPPGSSAYVPKEPEKDTQLQFALRHLQSKKP